MTATATARPPATAAPVSLGSARNPVRRVTVRVLLAALSLFSIYALAALLDDPRGTLGTDTGGKLATLRVMDGRGALDPDIGYWAERLDPDGSLHPLWYTRAIGDRWVNVTTLPMPSIGLPLYHVGGERAVLVLPMMGAVATALAARALARRLDGDRAGWWAFWLVGLTTPVAIYALDFWEHALGLAAVLWAFVLAMDVVEDRGGSWAACGAGALLGLAATMRTEALVYGLVGGVVALVVMARRQRSRRRIVTVALCSAGGALAVIAANQVLERVVLGATLRAGRAADTAAAGAADLGRRLDEAVTTLVGMNRFATPFDWVIGAGAVIALMCGAARCLRDDPRARRSGAQLLGVAAFLYVVRFTAGLGFVPGLLAASPLAAAGLTIGLRSGRTKVVAAVALAALPLVWVFQYSGGASPQWGARYLLVSGTLLAVLATVRLATAPRLVQVALVTIAAAVTACGVAWLADRSHAVADAMEHVVARHDDVVISREAHLLREGGAFYAPDRRWLTALTDDDLTEALDVAVRSGADQVALVQVAGRPRPRALGPFTRRGGEDRVELLPGLRVTVTSYERPPG